MRIYDIDGNLISVDGTSENKAQKHRPENGVLNALNVTKQFCNISWTTVNSGMPDANETPTTLSSNTTTKGLPYTSATAEDGLIGIDISLYTFMSALHNPRSVLYTERSKSYHGYAFYGTVCTSLICAAWGLPCQVSTMEFDKVDYITAVTFDKMELGDMILRRQGEGGHAMMISGIKRDENGAITHVRTSESRYTHCYENAYQTYDAFVSSHNGYIPYRYNGINSAKSYIPYPTCPMPDENESEITFPDIMTVYGDKVTRKKGTDIGVTVLDNSGYVAIWVFRDGERIDTRTELSDFTLTAPDVGLYEVRMVGVSKSSSTFFDIVDCSATIDEDTVTFNTTYSAKAVGGYPTYSKDSSGKATTWNHHKRVRFLTDAENVNRTFDISDMHADNDCTGGILLYVGGVFGNVSFEFPY